MSVRKVGESYISENVHLKYHSSLTNDEAEKLVGKEIQKVESGSRSLILTFTDGTRMVVKGFTLDEEMQMDSLDIKLEEKTIDIT